MDGAHAALLALNSTLATLKAHQMKLSEEIKTASDQKSLLEKDVTNLEDKVALLGRIRDLEEERKRLEDGTPCPLCGSFDHPYATGNIPELGEAEGALKKFKAEYKRMSDALVKLEKEQVTPSPGCGNSNLIGARQSPLPGGQPPARSRQLPQMPERFLRRHDHNRWLLLLP